MSTRPLPDPGGDDSAAFLGVAGTWGARRDEVAVMTYGALRVLARQVTAARGGHPNGCGMQDCPRHFQALNTFYDRLGERCVYPRLKEANAEVTAEVNAEVNAERDAAWRMCGELRAEVEKLRTQLSDLELRHAAATRVLDEMVFEPGWKNRLRRFFLGPARLDREILAQRVRQLEVELDDLRRHLSSVRRLATLQRLSLPTVPDE